MTGILVALIGYQKPDVIKHPWVSTGLRVTMASRPVAATGCGCLQFGNRPLPNLVNKLLTEIFGHWQQSLIHHNPENLSI